MAADFQERFTSLVPGDIVCLSDEQTISDLLKSGDPRALHGLQLEVVRVRHVREQHGLCDWYLADLGGQPDSYPSLVLLVKAVDEETDIRIYYTPSDLAHARTRGDLVNDGALWVFREPEDPSHFQPCDLAYADSIVEETEEGRIEFAIKGGELHGVYREDPIRHGVPLPQPATVVEYSTRADCENPERLILDVGGLDEYGDRIAEGGVVHYFQGAHVRHNDISIIKH